MEGWGTRRRRGEGQGDNERTNPFLFSSTTLRRRPGQERELTAYATSQATSSPRQDLNDDSATPTSNTPPRDPFPSRRFPLHLPPRATTFFAVRHEQAQIRQLAHWHLRLRTRASPLRLLWPFHLQSPSRRPRAVPAHDEWTRRGEADAGGGGA